MLSKQSIRGNVKIYIEQELVTKQEVLQLSENWSEKEETLFRKMLKQGGQFKIQGVKFNISAKEIIFDSKGNIAVIQTPLDHSGDDVDLEYLL